MWLLLVTLGYSDPKVQDPETVLRKLDNFAFQNTNLSLRGLNTVEITRNFASLKWVDFQGYGHMDISSGHSEEGVRLSYRFKLKNERL